MGSCWDEAIKLEQDVAKYHARQCLNGVGFDMEEATHLANHLERELRAVIRLIMKDIPLKAKQHLTTVNKPFLKNRDMSKSVLEWYGTKNDVVAPFTRITFEPLNINSHIQIKDYLLTQGWQPTTYTEKGSPKLTEDSYHSIEGDVGRLLAKKNVLTHRLNMVRNPSKEKGFVYMVRGDGRIEADAITLGASTGRYRHIGVVNVPKADPSVLYGEELRSLFIAGDGYVCLGSDADSLEARMEAHYVYQYDKGGKYVESLVNGDSKFGTDIHTRNSGIWNVSRSKAKNGKYALTYGCTAGKLAETLGKSKREGKKYFDMFWNGNIALDRLNKAVQRAIKGRNYLIGLDGRKIFIRSAHSALNALFQSAGCIVVKKATVLINERLDAAGFDWKQMIHMHDEVLLAIKVGDADEVSEIVKQCWIDAGEMLGIKVPITGDIAIGESWKEVH